MRLERWLHEWDVFLLILAVGLLTGLITYMAFDTHPASCHLALSHLPGRAHFTWVCSRP
jgi:hypothetical protein